MAAKTLYETDAALWSERQARLLREGRFDEVDVGNIAEEIESLGRSDKRQLGRRIAEIIEHKLKLDLLSGRDRHENERRWNMSIAKQRVGIEHLFRESPSLRGMLTPEFLAECYGDGVRDFTDSDFGSYAKAPRECPFTWEEILGEGFKR
jgi:Domain of unknown function DUF29